MVGHDGVQADTVLEEELSVLNLDTQAARDCLTGPGLCIYEISNPASTVTHFLQPGHTYSNRATPPNSAPPYKPNVQTHESMGVIPIQTMMPPWKHGTAFPFYGYTT